jgi:hypothetical protein
LGLATDGWCAAIAGQRSETDGYAPLSDTVLWLNGKTVTFNPPLLCPRVAVFDDHRVAIVECRITRRGEINAWIFSQQGVLLTEFSVGDGVEDLLATSDRLIVTYFDEGVFGFGNESGNEGLAVFGTDGRLEFGYHTQFGWSDHEIADCYAASLDSEGRVVFCAYSSFDLVRLDLEHRTRERWETPQPLHSCHALTMLGDTCFFGGGRYGANVRAWNLGGEWRDLGVSLGDVQGLPGGRFLALGESGYTIIYPAED